MTLPSEESLPAEPRNEPLSEFSERCDAIEEAYEFMLAYAAQGLATDGGSTSGSQIRAYLLKCEAALTGLCNAVTSSVRRLDVDSKAPYDAFAAVVERDVRSALAAVALVLAQPSISSLLVDNLNASIHLRTVLTDLFLLDEVLKK
jgi:hypothetical protein